MDCPTLTRAEPGQEGLTLPGFPSIRIGQGEKLGYPLGHRSGTKGNPDPLLTQEITELHDRGNAFPPPGRKDVSAPVAP